MKTKINSILKIILLLVIVSPVYQVFGYVDDYDKPISTKSTRSDTWILDFQQNGFNNLQWYYDHLNDQDREKIRQAFDWSVDREYIINNIENGLGTKTLSFIHPGTQYSLNNGTVPRQLDLTKAKTLLTEVFGYTYNATFDNPATPYDETRPYFSLTSIYPANIANRIIWAHQVAANWKSIGIDVTSLDISALESINDYIDTDQSAAGFGYGDGGFDVAFVGWGDCGYGFYSPSLELYRFDIQIPQTNFVSPILDEIYHNIHYGQNETLRNQAIYDYEQWVYNNVPASYLFLQSILNIKNKDLVGIDPSVRTNYENWTYSGHQNATVMVQYAEELQNLNPLYFPYQYPAFYLYQDTKFAGDALYRGMFYRASTINQGIEEVNYYPYFANWYNKSADGKTWFVNLKQGLKWHDGVELNSSDIKFTFDSFNFNNESLAEMNGNSYWYQPWLTGNINISIINGTLIKFELQYPYAFFKEDYLTLQIIPKHIMEKVPEEDWLTDSFNTGINGTVVGNGPYIYVNKSTDQTALTLQKWNYWDSNYQALIENNAMNEPIPGISAPTLDYINFITIDNPEDALNLLKNGSADITLQLRYEYDFRSIIDQIVNPVVPIIEKGFADQTIIYNLKSPIWGIEAVKPCTLYENISCPTTATTPTSENIDAKGTFNYFGLEFVLLVVGFITIALVVVYKRKTK